MKSIFQIIITTFLISLVVASCSDQPFETINQDHINIPDNRFKSKLLDAGYDLNNDGEISYAEAKMIVTVDISEHDPTSPMPKIKDITGIEAFTNLEYFECYGNAISGEIGFSKNKKLILIDIGFNNISDINIINLTNLIELDVSGNRLSSLDLSTNVSLKKLSISLNNLTSIDITKNVELEELSFLGNSFTTIDFSKNIHLKKLGISGAQHNITSIDISSCVYLEYLSISYIDISRLDISNNRYLQSISLGFLDNLEEICVWEIPFPDSIEVNFINCNATFVLCD